MFAKSFLLEKEKKKIIMPEIFTHPHLRLK